MGASPFDDRDTRAAGRALALLMAVAVVTRGLYLWLTADQPLWWDEAEYLLQGRHLAFGTPNTGYFDARPPGMAWTAWALFRVGLGEPGFRVLLAALSVVCVYLVASIGRALFDAWTGLIAAALFAFSYLELFHTFRILSEIPHLAFGLLGVRLYLLAGSPWRWLWIPAVGVATLMRHTGALFAVFPVGASLLTDGRRWLADRRVAIGIAAAVAAVVLITAWSAWQDSTWLRELRSWSWVLLRAKPERRLHYLGFYAEQFARNLGWVALPFFIAGAVATALDFRRADERRVLFRAALLLVWVAVPTLLFGAIVGAAIDRYTIALVPALFLLAANAMLRAAGRLGRLERCGRRVALGALAAVVAASAIELAAFSHDRITAKSDTFDSLRSAGRWILDHSAPGDVVLARKVPQITWYSERATHDPGKQEQFRDRLDDPAVRYVVIDTYDRWRRRGRWIYDDRVPARYGLRLEVAFPPERPRVRVYSLR